MITSSASMKGSIRTLKHDVTQEKVPSLTFLQCLCKFLGHFDWRTGKISHKCPVRRGKEEDEHHVNEKEKEISMFDDSTI